MKWSVYWKLILWQNRLGLNIISTKWINSLGSFFLWIKTNILSDLTKKKVQHNSRCLTETRKPHNKTYLNCGDVGCCGWQEQKTNNWQFKNLQYLNTCFFSLVSHPSIIPPPPHWQRKDCLIMYPIFRVGVKKMESLEKEIKILKEDNESKW